MSKRDAMTGSENRPLLPEPVVAPMTFIVRLSPTATGRVIGVVEHPGTGRKERFDGLDALGPVIVALTVAVGGPQLSTASAGPPPGPAKGRAPPGSSDLGRASGHHADVPDAEGPDGAAGRR